MNNEEKILSTLETLTLAVTQIQEEQRQMRAEQRQMQTEQQQMRTEQQQMQTEQQQMRAEQRAIRNSQLKVELEMFPKIAAALDGFAVVAEKNAEQDDRILKLESKAENHGARIWALEHKGAQAR